MSRTAAHRSAHRHGASAAKITLANRLARALAHHRDSLRRALSELLGAPVASLLTLLVLAIAIGLPALLQVGLNNLGVLAGRWDDAAQISLFLKPELELADAEALALRLAQRPDISELKLINRDAALAELKQGSGFSEAIAQLDSNPLPHVLAVTPSEPEPVRAEQLLAELQAVPEVAMAQLDITWVKRLSGLLALGERLLLLVGAGLGLGVLLVIGNTIRLAVHNRREEIEVLKLVGASDSFVRRPFLYNGLVLGVLAGGLAWGLIELSLLALAGPVANLSGLYGSHFQLLGLIPLEGVALLALAGALGWLGAYAAVGRHLRDIELR